MKTYVMIVPEPHIWDKSFKGRVDYPAEIRGYLYEMIGLLEALDGERIVIFPGDIFHRGFTQVPNMAEVLSLFQHLNELTSNRVYSCVGNHELTYRTNNPFWMMASDSTSRFKDMQGLSAYSSVSQGLKIVDRLDCGPLKFIFGHYGRTDFDNDNLTGDAVLISHNAILEPEIDSVVNKLHHTESISEYLNVKPVLSSGSIPIVPNLKYVFVGHMHTYHSTFDVDETVGGVHLQFVLQYLGSLGRTAVNEVNDFDLDRTIPLFEITSSSTYEYKPLKLQLKPRRDIVLEDVVQDGKKAYAAKKIVKALQESNVFGETAEQCIERQLSSYPDLLTLFSRVYRGEQDIEIQKLLMEADS